MSFSKSREILHFSKNIMRDGLHFTNLTVKVLKSLAVEVNGREIIKAGTVVGKDGTKQNGANAYGLIYEDVDCTNEEQNYIFAPVVVQGVVEEGRLPEVLTPEAKTALKDIFFEVGPNMKADQF